MDSFKFLTSSSKLRGNRIYAADVEILRVHFRTERLIRINWVSYIVSHTGVSETRSLFHFSIVFSFSFAIIPVYFFCLVFCCVILINYEWLVWTFCNLPELVFDTAKIFLQIVCGCCRYESFVAGIFKIRFLLKKNPILKDTSRRY